MKLSSVLPLAFAGAFGCQAAQPETQYSEKGEDPADEPTFLDREDFAPYAVTVIGDWALWHAETPDADDPESTEEAIFAAPVADLGRSQLLTVDAMDESAFFVSYMQAAGDDLIFVLEGENRAIGVLSAGRLASEDLDQLGVEVVLNVESDWTIDALSTGPCASRDRADCVRIFAALSETDSAQSFDDPAGSDPEGARILSLEYAWVGDQLQVVSEPVDLVDTDFLENAFPRPERRLAIASMAYDAEHDQLYFCKRLEETRTGGFGGGPGGLEEHGYLQRLSLAESRDEVEESLVTFDTNVFPPGLDEETFWDGEFAFAGAPANDCGDELVIAGASILWITKARNAEPFENFTGDPILDEEELHARRLGDGVCNGTEGGFENPAPSDCPRRLFALDRGSEDATPAVILAAVGSEDSGRREELAARSLSNLTSNGEDMYLTTHGSTSDIVRLAVDGASRSDLEVIATAPEDQSWATLQAGVAGLFGATENDDFDNPSSRLHWIPNATMGR